MRASHPAQRRQHLQNGFKVFNRIAEESEAASPAFETSSSRASAASFVSPSNVAVENVATENAQLRAILTALPAGVVVLDGSGRISQSNPMATALLGEPLLGEIWATVIARVFKPRSDDGHDISLQDGRRVSISTCPLAGVPGQVLLITDVTETRKLQDNINQHQRLISMGEMAAGLAHQIRTPLSSSLLFASQLKSAHLDADTRVRVADKVMNQLRQLESLISDMLMFSRSGYSGDECISAEALLDDVVSASAHRCEQREIDLQVSCDLPGSQVRGNPRILSSAIQNLVNNAIQAIGQQGSLHLHARAGVCDTLEICVSDDGPGIAEDIQRELFKPFFTTRSDGTGLGLAVVQAVARAHGGSVRLESTPGEGSCFIVQLPIAHSQENSTYREAV